MKNVFKTWLSATVVLLLTACGPKIYKSKEMDQARREHKTVAILPAAVTMKLRPMEMKKMTAAQLIDLQERTGLDIQDKMYSWLLRRSDRFDYTVTFQDVSKTNALLSEHGVDAANLGLKDRAELAEMLGVDAVLQARAAMDKPMSDGAAVAVGLLLGAWGATNNVQTTINLHNGNTGNLIWKYDYSAAGSVGSSTQSLVNALMRNASKHFPYRK